MLKSIEQTASWLAERAPFAPKVAIVLGTGLGKLAEEIEVVSAFPYADIPNFPVSTVEGHTGQLIYGRLGSSEVIALQGRFHFYEGYPMAQVTFYVRVLAMLGIETLMLSNAAGGTNPRFEIGTLMVITDHINMFPEHPLHGPNLPMGPRFPDMSEAYSRRLIALANEVAAERGIGIEHGVYLGTQGPTYETPAEYRMFRLLGADAVGMSTVPEVIVARHAGLEVFGMSIITDMGVEGQIVEVTHEEVQRAANAVQPLMAQVMGGVIERLSKN